MIIIRRDTILSWTEEVDILKILYKIERTLDMKEANKEEEVLNNMKTVKHEKLREHWYSCMHEE